MMNDAKRKILQELKKNMMKEDDMGLGEKLKGLKKVTIASTSKEGLEKGLDKAQEILKKRSKMMGIDKEDEECEEMEDESSEELEARIDKLEKKLEE